MANARHLVRVGSNDCFQGTRQALTSNFISSWHERHASANGLPSGLDRRLDVRRRPTPLVAIPPNGWVRQSRRGRVVNLP